MADPEACAHDDFAASVEVNRLTRTEGGPVTAYSADVRIHCVVCAEPFEFIGCPPVSVVGNELHVPIRPVSSKPEFGLDSPGFTVRVVG